MLGRTLRSEIPAVLLLACIISLLINFPLWQRLITSNEWQYPDILYESNDEQSYLSRIREAADGYPWIGQPFLYENREKRYLLGNVFENLYAFPVRAWGWEMKTVSIIADALFPFLLVLALWWSLRSLLSPVWRSTVIAFLLLGGSLALWKRPVNPQASALLPILDIGFFLPVWRTHYGAALVRSLLMSVMIYAYAYYWTYALTAEGLLLITTILQRRSAPQILRYAAAAFLPFLLLSLPWIAIMLQSGSDQTYQETTRRLSLLDRRLPTAPHIQVILLFLTLLVAGINKYFHRWKEGLPLLMLLGSGLIVLNQNVLTGKEYAFSSHYGFLLRFPLWISFIWTLSIVTHNRRCVRLGILTGIFVMVGIKTLQVSAEQWQNFQKIIPTDAQRSEQKEMILSLRALPQKQVILMDMDQTELLTVYSNHYPFFSNSSHLHIATDALIWDRALVQQALFPEKVIEPRSVVGSVFIDKALVDRTRCMIHALLALQVPQCPFLPETYLPEQWHSFHEDAALLSSQALMDALSSAHVTYVLATQSPPQLENNVRLIQEFDHLRLYEFIPN